MKQFIIDCYEIREAGNGGFGGSMSDRHLYYVSTEEVAAVCCSKAIVGKSQYLSFRPYKQTITVFDSVAEIEAASKEVLRVSALAKLSAAEKAALGL